MKTTLAAGVKPASKQSTTLRDKADQRLLLVAEAPAALIVLAEVVLLFVGVTAHYISHQLVTWADGLALTLSYGSSCSARLLPWSATATCG